MQNNHSAYEYLERRFNLAVRGLGAVIFVRWRVGWMTTALYVPCLAVSSAIGREDLLIPMIITLGSLVTFYTMLGIFLLGMFTRRATVFLSRSNLRWACRRPGDADR